MSQIQEIKEINSIDMTDAKTVLVNNSIEMDFEDLGALIEDGLVSEQAMLTYHHYYGNGQYGDYKKFLRRINYLFYNSGQHITRDSKTEKHMYHGLMVFRITSGPYNL